MKFAAIALFQVVEQKKFEYAKSVPQQIRSEAKSLHICLVVLVNSTSFCIFVL